MEALGRKIGLIVSQVIGLAGWTLIGAAVDLSMICVGRFVAGVAAAATALIGNNTYNCHSLDRYSVLIFFSKKRKKNDYLSSIPSKKFLPRRKSKCPGKLT
jgi:hypothetical protein